MLSMGDWKYYNHAAVPANAPHEEKDTRCILDGSIWSMFEGRKPILARWTSRFDCGYETPWWFCIKESPFDIASLSAKRRYEINKGRRNFEVRVIDPVEFGEELLEVQAEAFKAYPHAYRPSVDRSSFMLNVIKWRENKVYGAFHRHDQRLVGYSILRQHESYAELSVQKTIPEYERLGVNAALVYQVCEDLKDLLGVGYYISDGERTISHETAFQEYLGKYFGFRKAYCILHIRYRQPLASAVALLYPFRRVLRKLAHVRMAHQLNAVLLMEEIVREQKNG